MMTETTNWRDVPVPPRMAALPRDARGFPIPHIVFRDTDGRPHFTVNHEPLRQEAITRGLCSICGQPLFRGRWFVGGPLSAFDEHGAYLDPPMHEECVAYALQVCPYLASRKYNSRIDGMTLDPDKAGEATMIGLDSTMIPERPDLFVAVMAIGQRLIRPSEVQLYIKPRRPYRRVEYWRAGQRLPREEGEAEVRAIMKRPLPDDLLEPRVRPLRLA